MQSCRAVAVFVFRSARTPRRSARAAFAPRDAREEPSGCLGTAADRTRGRWLQSHALSVLEPLPLRPAAHHRRLPRHIPRATKLSSPVRRKVAGSAGAVEVPARRRRRDVASALPPRRAPRRGWRQRDGPSAAAATSRRPSSSASTAAAVPWRLGDLRKVAGASQHEIQRRGSPRTRRSSPFLRHSSLGGRLVRRRSRRGPGSRDRRRSRALGSTEPCATCPPSNQPEKHEGLGLGSGPYRVPQHPKHRLETARRRSAARQPHLLTPPSLSERVDLVPAPTAQTLSVRATMREECWAVLLRVAELRIRVELRVEVAQHPVQRADRCPAARGAVLPPQPVRHILLIDLGLALPAHQH